MLIYDRRRCRPLRSEEMRKRLTSPQRAQLHLLESEGWQLRFVRGKGSAAFLSHDDHGYGMLACDGRLVAVSELPQRQDNVEMPPPIAPAWPAASAVA